MDVLLLSRLQFAATCFFHFLFVPLTLGLVLIVALMETRYVRTGDETYRRMTRFWGKLFAINFAIGVITGITLEFQLGTNWSRYSRFVGDIFGALLAIEATVAFFLESTFLAVWLFGWKRLSPRLHLAAIWIVAAASTMSAFWILCANAWMQHPVGYVIRNDRAELSDFFAIITQPLAWISFAHTLFAAYILAGFFVMGVCAWRLLKPDSDKPFFIKSFQYGMWFALIFAVLEGAVGHGSGLEVTKTQPLKLAAMEAHWETSDYVPMHLIVIPSEKQERNLVELIPVPSMLSVLAYGRPSAEVKGLKDFPKEDRPPVLIVYWAFRVMVGLFPLFLLLPALAWLWRKNLTAHPKFLWLLVWAIPLPYIAIQAGWVVTEVGRQPWIVYNVMRTADAVSPIATSQVALSLAAFIVVYSILGIANFTILARLARRGPEPAAVAPADSTEG